jgi:hypothetical protein
MEMKRMMMMIMKRIKGQYLVGVQEGRNHIRQNQ